MNGYLNGLKMDWNNKAVQSTIASIGGFIAGRAYPAVRKKAEKGLQDLQQKWEKEDAPAEQSEHSEEG